MYKTAILFSIISIFILSSCKEQSEKDQKLIEDYIERNGLETQVTDEGIHYIITREGQGERPDISSTIEVHYEGFTLDDEKFDSSYDRQETAIFPLANLIRGWVIGLQLIEEGGAITLIIPSEYAYGNSPPPGDIIGRDEVLLFNLELIDVQ